MKTVDQEQEKALQVALTAIHFDMKALITRNLSDGRITDNTKEIVFMLGCNKSFNSIAKKVGIVESNIFRIRAKYSGLIKKLNLMYDEFCIKTLPKDHDDYRISRFTDVDVVTVEELLQQIDALDKNYIEFLIDTVDSDDTTASVKISAMKELQTLRAKLAEGKTTIPNSKNVEETTNTTRSGLPKLKL
jgi:hypothetical protein